MFYYFEHYYSFRYLYSTANKILLIMAQVIWNPDIDVYNPLVIPVPIAKTIARYLQLSDLLIFANVSKNTYKTVNDPKLWIMMLKDIGIWDEKNGKTEINFQGFNALNCMDITVSNPRIAKKTVLHIYRCLFTYYTDLLSNKSYDKLKIFQEFKSPEQQCKILNNMLSYSKIDRNDESRYNAQEKLTSLFEIFENALLRELDIHFDLEDFDTMKRFVNILLELNNHQTLIDFFIQKSVLDNRQSMFSLLESVDTEEFYVKDQESFQLHVPRFDALANDIASILNYESKIIDLIFPRTIPMMYKVSEELILNQLSDRFNSVIDSSKPKGLYLDIVPFLYNVIKQQVIPNLKGSSNLGEGYKILIQELFDMQFEQVVSEYAREEIIAFRTESHNQISQWTRSIEKREEETSQNIWRNVKSETKNDFLTSFRKAFTVGSSTEQTEEQDQKTYSEIQAKEKILTENMKSITKIFSLKLAMSILNEGRHSLSRLLHFEDFSIASLRNSVLSSVQEIFVSVLELIGNDHLRPGFDKALFYLRTYKPTEIVTETIEPIEPLILFSDLVNIADLIIQMVEIFYKEELINRRIIKNENSILNPSLQKKKKLEEMVDNYVADGLNIGLDVLIGEIENCYSSVLTNKDYCPQDGAKGDFEGPTQSAQRVIQILDGNFDLLVGCAEKSVVDVFQQELAERFFQVVVKVVKKSTISNTGAVTLISDLNIYYDCIFKHIKTNKRLILPLFQSLKKVGNIYLINGDDSKAIGKLVSDLSKFNGIFSQEEIYEFVQRREDWQVVRKDVEKIMYGLSIDCVIM